MELNFVQTKKDEKVEACRLDMNAEMISQGAMMPAHFLISGQSHMPIPSMATSGSSEISTKGKTNISGGDRPGTIADMFNVKTWDATKFSIAKLLYAHAIPFHVACSSNFKQMINDIALLVPHF